MLWRESRREARRDVGGDGGHRGDSGSRGVEWQLEKKRLGSVHQLQQATDRWRSLSMLDWLSEKLTNHMHIGFPTAGRMVSGK